MEKPQLIDAVKLPPLPAPRSWVVDVDEDDKAPRLLTVLP